MRSTSAKKSCTEANRMRRSPKAASGDDFRLQLALLAEKQDALPLRSFARDAPGTPIHSGRARAGGSGELRSGRVENRARRGFPG